MKGRTVYVFQVKRPIDTEPWPLVFEDSGRAQRAPHRVTAVVQVHLPDVGDFKQVMCDVIAEPGA